MPSFTIQVKTGKIPQPPQRSFTLEKWEKAFNKINEPSDEDYRLYRSGKWVFNQFQTVRKKLQPINFDNVSKQTHIRLLVGVTNRVTNILSHIHLPIGDNKIMFAEQPLQATLRNINPVSPNSNPDMVLSSSIDGLRFPLKLALSRQKDSSTSIVDEILIENIFRATVYGQYYDHIDSYWMYCLWNGWYLDTASSIDIVKPPETDFPIIEGVSEYRRQVLGTEFSFHFNSFWLKSDDETKASFYATAPVVFTKGSGKKTRYGVKRNLSDNFRSRIIIINRLRAEKGYYAPFFLEGLPVLDQITINDLMNVWEVLHSLAMAQIDRLSSPGKEREIKKIDDILIYAPVLYFDQTIEILKKWLNFSINKIKNILAFFSFKSDLSAQLWCKPIIQLDNKSFILLWTPLVYGNIERTVELWMKEGKFDFGKNGFIFENYARKDLIEFLDKFSKLEDAEVYPDSIDFTVNDGREEIDIVIRIGNTILVGEIKCILYPSEPIERSRYFEILVNASKQVERKVNFVKNNEKQFVEKINFKDRNSNESLRFFPFVLMNQPFGAGFVVGNVPIVDLLILHRFFENKWEQFALFDGENNPISARIVNFYKDDAEAADIVNKYLCKPPQLEHYKNSIKPEIYKLPILDSDEKPVCFATVNVSLSLPKKDYELIHKQWR